MASNQKGWAKGGCQPLDKEMGKSTNAWEQGHGGNE